MIRSDATSCNMNRIKFFFIMVFFSVISFLNLFFQPHKKIFLPCYQRCLIKNYKCRTGPSGILGGGWRRLSKYPNSHSHLYFQRGKQEDRSESSGGLLNLVTLPPFFHRGKQEDRIRKVELNNDCRSAYHLMKSVRFLSQRREVIPHLSHFQ